MSAPLDDSQQTTPVHLVVVELHYHAELIKTLYQILTLSNFRITLITLPGIFSKTALPEASDDGKFRAHLKHPEESIAKFLGRMDAVFRSADILYFNTIRHHWRELNDVPISATAIVRIHNAHCDFTRLSNLHRPFVNSLGILSHLVRKVLIGKEWEYKDNLFKKIDYFMFPNKTITEYVESNAWVDPKKVLPPVFPFGFLGERPFESKREEKKETVIAITGKVTNSKKDFDLVYLALKQSLSDIEFPLKLVLLGNAGQKHAKSIIQKFKSLESDRFSLDYSDGYVPADVFDEKVSSVDFFVAPIKIHTHFRKYHEIYGRSKMSGIDNDILLYRKPSLVISDYKMEFPLSRVVDYFEPTPASLGQKLVEWVNHRKFSEADTHFDQMKEYERQVIADNFYRLCRKIMQSPRELSEGVER